MYNEKPSDDVEKHLIKLVKKNIASTKDVRLVSLLLILQYSIIILSPFSAELNYSIWFLILDIIML